MELAGDIESVGKTVGKFKPGDSVFAYVGIDMGCYAEYKCMSEDGAVVLKPPNLNYQEAAALSFGGTTALNFLNRAKIKSGEKVLVNGASGAVGSAAIEIAKHFGAEVTGVCSSANLKWVRSLKAVTSRALSPVVFVWFLLASTSFNVALSCPKTGLAV